MTRPNLYRLRRHARVARERHALRHLRQHFEMVRDPMRGLLCAGRRWPCALRQIRQAEIDLEAARAGRYSRVTTDRATMGLGRPESPPGSTGAASGENHPPGEETD